jgi:DinB family
MRRSDTLIADNIELLEQGVGLIERLDDALYSKPNPRYSMSGAGSHFRHCMDFYDSFLAGLKSGRINYDSRKRDELVATDRSAATRKMSAIIGELRALRLADGQKDLQVTLENSVHTDSPAWSRSSVTRELQSLLSHTTHHYALIALALRLQGVEPCRDFGIAPSTLAHLKEAS